MPSPKYREITVGENPPRRIACLTQPGTQPGILWLQGFKSDMVSTKATALSEWTQAEGLAFTRFDYSGHGQSGGNFEDGTLSQWLEEAAAVFDKLTDGPQIVVGSSMGGHIAMLLARTLQARSADNRPGRIRALILIAPAWDMTELMWGNASEEARRAIMEEGVWYRPSQYGEPYAITRNLVEDGRRHLFSARPWNPGCPVDIIHGRLDPDVPFVHSEKLVGFLEGQPVHLIEVPDGEHRLSRPEDLSLLCETIRRAVAAAR